MSVCTGWMLKYGLLIFHLQQTECMETCTHTRSLPPSLLLRLKKSTTTKTKTESRKQNIVAVSMCAWLWEMRTLDCDSKNGSTFGIDRKSKCIKCFHSPSHITVGWIAHSSGNHNFYDILEQNFAKFCRTVSYTFGDDFDLFLEFEFFPIFIRVCKAPALGVNPKNWEENSNYSKFIKIIAKTLLTWKNIVRRILNNQLP